MVGRPEIHDHYGVIQPDNLFRIFEQNPVIGLPLNLIYSSFFAQSLVLLMYHFVYRYIVVCRDNWLHQVHQLKSILLSVAFYIITTLAWVLVVYLTLCDPVAKDMLADQLMAEIGVDVHVSGMFSFVYWFRSDSGLVLNPVPWIGGIYILIYMSFIFSIMSYCAFSIQKTLRRSQSSANANAHQLQVQLFRALIIQTAVPIVLEYGSATVIMFAPMIGLPVDGAFTTLFISTYPVVEPLVVIYFVRDYRNALTKRLRTAPSSVSAAWFSGF